MGDEVEVRVLDVDLDRERISLSLKATQSDPWQEFANAHRVGELVYGRVTKLVPFGAFVQVGEGIEGLVHISEMANHHVDLPEQVVSPSEELWVKIIEIDLQRRRISLSIKQAAEGGEVAAEYREAFGEHAYDEQGNYIGGAGFADFEPESEAQAAWAEYLESGGVAAPEGEAEGEVDSDATARSTATSTARSRRLNGESTAELDGVDSASRVDPSEPEGYGRRRAGRSQRASGSRCPAAGVPHAGLAASPEAVPSGRPAARRRPTLHPDGSAHGAGDDDPGVPAAELEWRPTPTSTKPQGVGRRTGRVTWRNPDEASRSSR